MEKDQSQRAASPGKRHLDPKPNTEIGPSGECGVGVNQKGSLGEQSSIGSAGGSQGKSLLRRRMTSLAAIVIRRWMKNKSLEELGFVPSGERLSGASG